MHLLIEILVVLGALLAIAAFVQALAEKSSIPEATLLSLAGVAIGAAYAALSHSTPALAQAIFGPLVASNLPADAFLAVFLPPLLFQVALSVDVRRMVQDAAPILLLAVVAVFVATFAIGFALAPFVEHGLIACLLLGAIVATTDPSAVVGVFRDVGAPGRLIRLVEGESLLNDAAAIALVGVLVAMTTRDGNAGADWLDGLTNLGVSFGGGVLLGAIAGRLLTALLSLMRGIASAETALTMALVYPLYLFADESLGVSGVVAVVCAGLVINGLGRTRLTPRNWNHLQQVWQQAATLAGAIVFLLAAVRVPHLLAGVSWAEAGYLAIALAAALAARLAVLFGMFPLLVRWNLCEPISPAYKLAIAWGGLRGAVTLVLALGVAENPVLPQPIRHFVANMATGFVLFSLLINGATLRWTIRALRLDRLSPQEQMLQQQAIALATVDVEATVRRVAQVFRMPSHIAGEVNRQYHRDLRISTVDLDSDETLSERDRLAIGLTTLAQRERDLIPEYGDGILSVRNLDAMMRNTGQMIDAVRSEGRIGYNRVARRILDEHASYHLALRLHALTVIAWPLESAMTNRFELLICRRAVLERLRRYNTGRLAPLLGERMTSVLDGILAARIGAVEDAITQLRDKHPQFTVTLERRMLMLFALRQGRAAMETMESEHVVSGEVHARIQQELGAAWKKAIKRPRLAPSCDPAPMTPEGAKGDDVLDDDAEPAELPSGSSATPAP